MIIRRVMGVDMGFPGGISIVEDPRCPRLLHIEPISKNDTPLIVFERVSELLARYGIGVLATERPFTGKGDLRPKTGLAQREHQGQLKLACQLQGVRFVDYAPQTIKKAATGYGRATKEQVAAAMRRLFGVNGTLTEHEYDALSIGLLALNREG